MTNEEAIKYLKQLYPKGPGCWLDEQRMEAIDIAVLAIKKVDALQKMAENNSQVYNLINAMTIKTEKI